MISIQRPRPGSRLKRRTPRWGVDNISFIFFETFYTLHIIHNPIKLQGGRRESEEVVNVETWGAFGGSFLLFDHFLRLVMLWKVLSDFCIWYPLMCNKLNTTMPNCTPDVHCTTDIYAWVLSYVPHHCQDMCRWCEICSALMTHGCGCSNIC